MERPGWAPDDVDIERPSAARIYDYLLGGSHNFAVDRAFADQVTQAIPDSRLQARANRAFLLRAVRHLADAGVRQFLDLGSGIPASGSVHEVARRVAPDSRVVYVDNDPVAVAHARALLTGDDAAAVVRADVRDADGILGSAEVARLFDLDQPVALLMVAILHVVPDADDPAGLIGRLRAPLAPGSHLVIGHATGDSRPDSIRRLAEMSKQTPTPLTIRTHAEVSAFFAGFTLLEPGLVWVSEWRPDPGDEVADPSQAANYGGVGRIQLS